MAQEEPAVRSARTDALWTDVKIDPLEIALPGVAYSGYTLRAYRPANTLAQPEAAEEVEEELDPFDAAAAARRAEADEEFTEELGDEFDAHEAGDRDEEPGEAKAREAGKRSAGDDQTSDHAPDEADVDEDAEEAATERGAEEVPVFLGRRGRLYLFHSAEKLVEFVRSGAEHDLTQLDTWEEFVKRVRPEDVVPKPEDTYELDLVVDNLRGGHDVWDRVLIIKAGEIARDLAYALRLRTVQAMLAPGSPLDNLDETLRAAEAGGVSGFLARRRLRKIPAQQSALAWRTVIGRISAVADWRD